jgi:hypothetical protein
MAARPGTVAWETAMKTTTRLKPPCKPSYEPAPLRAVVADVPVSRLADFRDLMAGEGWSVDLQRMCHDRLYAYERMALAHTSISDGLRRAAVTLFADYERLPAAGQVH